ncbi:nucleolar protein 9 [Pelomyxa schiedti]|nr:nucleolar protein 9 [Pelomyxa schiedti]
MKREEGSGKRAEAVSPLTNQLDKQFRSYLASLADIADRLENDANAPPPAREASENPDEALELGAEKDVDRAAEAAETLESLMANVMVEVSGRELALCLSGSEYSGAFGRLVKFLTPRQLTRFLKPLCAAAPAGIPAPTRPKRNALKAKKSETTQGEKVEIKKEEEGVVIKKEEGVEIKKEEGAEGVEIKKEEGEEVEQEHNAAKAVENDETETPPPLPPPASGWEVMAVSSPGSQVGERLLEHAAKLVDTASSGGGGGAEGLWEVEANELIKVVGLSAQVLARANWAVLSTNPFASHLARKMIQVLSGYIPPTPKNRKPLVGAPNTPVPPTSPPRQFTHTFLPMFCAEILSSMSLDNTDAKNMSQFALDPNSSTLLQVMIHAMQKHHPALAAALAERVVQVVEDVRFNVLCTFKSKLVDQSLAEQDYHDHSDFGNTDDNDNDSDHKSAPRSTVFRNAAESNQRTSARHVKSGEKWVARKRYRKGGPAACCHPSASCLVEAVLSAISDKEYMRIFLQWFRGKLRTLASHPIANRVVQQLIFNMRHEALVNAVITELSPIFPDLIVGNTGVLVAIAQICVDYPTPQNSFCEHLLEGLKEVNTFRLTTGTSPGDNDHNQRNLAYQMELDKLSKFMQPPTLLFTELLRPCSYLPGYLAQFLVKFEPEIAIIAKRGARVLHGDYISLCARGVFASRFVEVLLKSKMLNEKERDHIFTHMQGSWAALAQDRSGSHVVELCYVIGNMELKSQIMKEMAENYDAVRKAGFWAEKLLHKCNVQLYMAKNAVWAESASRADSAKKAFSDFIDSTPGALEKLTETAQTVGEASTDKPEARPKTIESIDEESSLAEWGEYMEKLGFVGETVNDPSAQENQGEDAESSGDDDENDGEPGPAIDPEVALRRKIRKQAKFSAHKEIEDLFHGDGVTSHQTPPPTATSTSTTTTTTTITTQEVTPTAKPGTDSGLATVLNKIALTKKGKKAAPPIATPKTPPPAVSNTTVASAAESATVIIRPEDPQRVGESEGPLAGRKRQPRGSFGKRGSSKYARILTRF